MTRIESHSPNCYKVGGPYPCTCYNPPASSGEQPPTPPTCYHEPACQTDYEHATLVQLEGEADSRRCASRTTPLRCVREIGHAGDHWFDGESRAPSPIAPPAPPTTDVEVLLRQIDNSFGLADSASTRITYGSLRELAAALREANQRAEEADARADLEYGVRCQVDNELAAARAENARLARASIDIARAAVLKILQPHD